jgi:MerR family mercuric resistance operon transcriptional regulator
MTIGELADAANVGVETIRYYERRGIVPEPARTAAGYRQYTDDDLWRLEFIRRGKALGFTLQEIGELLGMHAGRSVADVRRLTEERLARVEGDLSELEQRRDGLRRLLATCDDGASDDCLSISPPAD